MRSIKLVSLMLLLTMAYIQCSKDHDPDLRAQKIAMLTDVAWVTESVQNSSDGDLTSQYTDFTIVFADNEGGTFDGDYYLTGGGIAFPELAGKWKLDDNLAKIVLATGREMKITITEESLRLEFDITASEGRGAGLSGHFIFTLKKI